MAEPSEIYDFLRGDYGDLAVNVNISQKVRYVDASDVLVVKYIIDAMEILRKQRRYVFRGEQELENLSIKGQVLRSLENARRLMSVYKGASISDAPYSLPPSQEDMKNFLDKWRKKRSNS